MNDRELYEQGRAHMKAGRLRDAVEAFRSSAEASPHFKTLELLGECYLLLGEPGRAVVPLAAASTLNEQSRAPSILADAFERLGDPERAADMARIALARDTGNRRARAILTTADNAGPWLSHQTVGVIGSGEIEHEEYAQPLGQLIAAIGANLLTGGGGGVMRSVSRAFTQSRRERGISIGIIPCASETDRATARDGYPNEFVELPIYTHLPYSGRQGTEDLSRNHVNVLSASAIVALPGGYGTASEVDLAVRYGKPVVAYSRDPNLVVNFHESVPQADTLEAVERFLRNELAIDGQ
jgi:uncharacterized protein (TIGR00725 family)